MLAEREHGTAARHDGGAEGCVSLHASARDRRHARPEGFVLQRQPPIASVRLQRVRRQPVVQHGIFAGPVSAGRQRVDTADTSRGVPLPVQLIRRVVSGEAVQQIVGVVVPDEVGAAVSVGGNEGRIDDPIRGVLSSHGEAVTRLLVPAGAAALFKRDPHDVLALREARIEIRASVQRLSRRPAVAQLAAPHRSQRTTVAEAHAGVHTDERVGERAIGHGVVGAEPRTGHQIVPAVAGGTDGSPDASGAEGTRLRGGLHVRPSAVCGGSVRRDQADYAGERVAAEQRGLGPAHQFDPCETVTRERADVDRAAWLVQRNTIQIDRVAVAFATADEEAGDAAGGTAADNGRARKRAQQVGDRRGLTSGNLRGRHR